MHAALLLLAPVNRDVLRKKVLIGFYKNRTVNYFDYGRIKLRPGNKLAPIWVFYLRRQQASRAARRRSIDRRRRPAASATSLATQRTVVW